MLREIKIEIISCGSKYHCFVNKNIYYRTLNILLSFNIMLFLALIMINYKIPKTRVRYNFAINF